MELLFSSVWKFAKFLLSFNKNATANRKTIASILVTIGEQGAPSTFDCSLLRNPDSIPEDYDSEKDVSSKEVSRESVTSLTRSDSFVAQDIESQSDNWIRSVLDANWPEIFKN